VHAHTGAVGQCDRQQRQHALFPQNLYLPGRQVVPRLLVPQVERDPADEPVPAQASGTRIGVQPELLHGAPERVGRGRVALGEPQHKAVEQQVDGTRRERRRRGRLRGTRHPGRGAVLPPHEPAGEHRSHQRFEVGLARHQRVEVPQVSCGRQQQRGRVPAAVHRERDLRAHQLDLGLPHGFWWRGLRVRDQLQHRIRSPGVQLRPRCRQSAAGARDRIWSQLGRISQERRRRGHSTAGPGQLGRALQLGRDRLVGTRRRLTTVPRAVLAIDLGIDRVGKRLVHAPAVSTARRSVDSGPDQRMAEPHPTADGDQLRRLRRFRGRFRHTEAFGSAPEQPHLPQRIRGDDEQQQPSVRRQCGQLGGETAFDASRQRPSLINQPEAISEHGQVRHPRQFQQSQRIAPRLPENALAHPLVHRAGHRRRQQGP
jgi:hypothetical protein